MMLSGCRVPRILHSVPVTQRARATWDLRPQSWTWSLVRGQALSLGLGDLPAGEEMGARLLQQPPLPAPGP